MPIDSMEVEVDTDSQFDEKGNLIEEGGPGDLHEQGEPQEPKEEEQEESLLAGKYKNPEELEKAYLELQKKQGQQAEEGPEPTDEGKIGETPEPDPVDPETVTLDTALENMQEGEEVAQETYDALAEKGISKDQVNRYVSSQMAVADRAVDDLKASVGGEKNFNAVLKWAAGNASEGQKQAYNTAVDNGNTEAAKAILAGIKAGYDTAQGVDPNLIEGENTPPSGVKPFKTEEEIAEIYASEKYQTDPEYRKKMDERMAATDWY